MADLVLRPSNDPAKPFSLQLRKHDSLGETGYFTLCRVTREIADEIISAGGAFWLFGEPKEGSNAE
ncbi:hypothetical protein N7376_15805 [Brucella intermedia GD04153]|uniref:Uncharacterized protein n=1 Tax=Brucella intermedia GD04153 TaxID=2975438 RepID=A0AA42H4K9_9HYPH|nr:hypothetical protein [Brucella intermedia]MDH0125473.1 hypothetical protein [Brucella intermedia GD04153]